MDYVLSTIAEIEALGCRDSKLHAIAERLKGGHEAHASALIPTHFAKAHPDPVG